MSSGAAPGVIAVGFLSVVEHPEHGLFGGYLILNSAGRPLEFHCTTPVKPTRAQQILYGPTLESFLYGEQIGRTLIEHGKQQPALLCADRTAMLSIREHTSIPVALVLPPENAETPERGQMKLRFDAAHALAGLHCFATGRNRVAVPVRFAADEAAVAATATQLSESLDLAEPFGRIREAIAEAARM